MISPSAWEIHICTRIQDTWLIPPMLAYDDGFQSYLKKYCRVDRFLELWNELFWEIPVWTGQMQHRAVFGNGDIFADRFTVQ